MIASVRLKSLVETSLNVIDICVRMLHENSSLGGLRGLSYVRLMGVLVEFAIFPVNLKIKQTYSKRLLKILNLFSSGILDLSLAQCFVAAMD